MLHDPSAKIQRDQRSESAASSEVGQNAHVSSSSPVATAWWETPRSEYLLPPPVDPAIYGIGREEFEHDPSSDADAARIALAGTSGPVTSMPHAETIQNAFGRHDLSHVRAHVGGDAARASTTFGANAFATGDHVAFAGAPDLHTAAHEATHTLQQRNGAVPFQGLGQRGDVHEQQADAVADAVVAGKSVEHMLDAIGGGSGAGSAAPIQRDEKPVVPWLATLDKPTKADEDARIARQQELNAYKSKPGPVVRDDEKPVLWGMNPRMPGTPPKEYTLAVEPVLPAWITWSGDPEFGRRNVYWQQFAEAVVEGNHRHARMRPALTRYQNAQMDPRLGALGVRVGDQPIDARALVESHRVPSEGGVDVGGLFTGDSGELALEDGDQQAIERARDAVLDDRGTVQATGDATSVADRDYAAATTRVKTAASEARAAAIELQGALRRVEAIFARRHAEDAKRELDTAQRRVSNAKAAVEVYWFGVNVTARVEGYRT